MVFGGDHVSVGRAVQAAMAEAPPMQAVLCSAGELPVAAGRVEFHFGTDFASIWGGGTRPGWRRLGIFKAMVAYRADVARELGFRYLQVGASPEGRPILERVGFVARATTTPFRFLVPVAAT
jgi:GNAT superfamily N-acetyltransferase